LECEIISQTAKKTDRKKKEEREPVSDPTQIPGKHYRGKERRKFKTNPYARKAPDRWKTRKRGTA